MRRRLTETGGPAWTLPPFWAAEERPTALAREQRRARELDVALAALSAWRARLDAKAAADVERAARRRAS